MLLKNFDKYLLSLTEELDGSTNLKFFWFYRLFSLVFFWLAEVISDFSREIKLSLNFSSSASTNYILLDRAAFFSFLISSSLVSSCLVSSCRFHSPLLYPLLSVFCFSSLPFSFFPFSHFIQKRLHCSCLQHGRHKISLYYFLLKA